MKASNLCFRSAVIFAVMGVLMGIAMAALHNHAQMPAHAHLNLLGWISLFLFGIFYKLHPASDTGLFAKVQVMLWIVGTLVLVTGVALIYAGSPSGEALASFGSVLVLIALVMFAVVVFKTTARDTQ